MTDRMFLHSSSAKPPLRLALLTDGSDPIEPFARVLRHLQACDFAALVVLLEDGGSAGREGAKANELLAPKSRSSKRH